MFFSSYRAVSGYVSHAADANVSDAQRACSGSVFGHRLLAAILDPAFTEIDDILADPALSGD